MSKTEIPSIRFRGFDDAWEQRKLGEVIRLNGRIGFRGYTEKDIVTKESFENAIMVHAAISGSTNAT